MADVLSGARALIPLCNQVSVKEKLEIDFLCRRIVTEKGQHKVATFCLNAQMNARAQLAFRFLTVGSAGASEAKDDLARRLFARLSH